MIRWPGIIGGTHKLVSWLNRLRAASMQTEIKTVIGGRLIQHSNGRELVIDPSKPVVLSTPFQIYQASSWLKFKVRDGRYVGTGNPITVTNTETELELTSGVARYWFYIESTATTAEVKKSATTLEWSSTKIPIGWVDTTDTTNNASVIYQLLTDHIFNPCTV